MFKVCEIEGKGKGLVATCAIKAGEVVHRELPLMMVSPEFQSNFPDHSWPGSGRLLAASCYFVSHMSPEQQERFLSLHGGQPMESMRKNQMRDLARRAFLKHGESIDEEDVELYARICMVVAYNAFGGEDNTKIYETASRFCHSCAPNCAQEFQGEEIILRAIRPIQEGEELTLDYFPTRQMEPIHVRRLKWVQAKDFTCHCPRCDAEGDDTRQFHCFDPACTGRHLVRQPLSTEPLGHDLAYTGVEYVEPHLLPCTVCLRSPPSEYQTAMFALEKKWAAKLKEVPCTPATTTSVVFAGTNPDGSPKLVFHNTGGQSAASIPRQIVDLQAMRYQLCHWLGFQLGLKELRLHGDLMQVSGLTAGTDRVRELVTQMDHALDTFFPLPSTEMLLYLMELHYAYLHLGDTANAVRLKRKLIRNLRILNGRDTISEPERAIAKIAKLEQPMANPSPGITAALSVEPPVPEGCCVYCGESPEHAAMKRSRCGACKQVIYCGAACQKAHWPAHKKECGK